MSLRSRALLTGIGTGFFRANNQRRAKMAERMQELASNRAEMERERAKSRYDAMSKAALAEQQEYAQLRSQGYINLETDEYTPTYWRDKTYDKWKESGYATQDEFIEVFKQGRSTKYQRQFKDSTEIEENLSKTYKAIDTRQREELSQPVMTGLERMLGRGIVAAGNVVGEAVGAEPVSMEPQAPTTEIPQFDPRAAQEPVEVIPEQGKTFKTQPKVRTLNQVIVDKEGRTHAVFADDQEKVVKVDLGITQEIEGGGQGNKNRSKIETRRLFDAENNVFFDTTVEYDRVNDEILVNGQWVKKRDTLHALPSDVELQELIYTDPDSGAEMKAQAYPTSGAATGRNIVRMPDGTTWAVTGNPVLYRGKRDVHEKPKIPEAVKNNLDTFAQQRKTASLASLMLQQDFISSPTNWVQSNLSVFTDMIGASIGLVGENRAEDLEAISDFIEAEVQDNTELKAKIGTLDAAAVRSGNKEAIENFLVFALARSQFGGGRLTVQAVEAAEDVVQQTISGSDYHRGTLKSVVTRSGDEMARIAGSDLALAMGEKDPLNSKIFDYYPRVRQKVEQGLTPVAERVDGVSIVADIKRLPEEAKAKTVRNLTQIFGSNWEEGLRKPMRFSQEYDTLIMPMYQKQKDGSYVFGMFPVK